MIVDIINAKVCFWNHGISFMTAKLEDQDLETLKALGRGQMFSLPCMTLRYTLRGVTVFLRCD